MSSVKFELIANNRVKLGKLASRNLRAKHNQVPAVIYGGKQSNHLVSLNHDALLKAAEHENFYSQILNLTVDGKTQKVVLKDLQRHPFKPKIIHLDFQRVSEDEIIHMQVPLHFIGADKCPGVKAGGVITHHANTVEIRCQAKFLPEYIEVDLSKIELGQIVHVADLHLPNSVEIHAANQTKLNSPVVSVQIIKASTEAANDVTQASASVTEDKDANAKDKAASNSKSATSASTKTDKK